MPYRITTPWLTPWKWYSSSTSIASDTTHEPTVDADGVESHSHEEEKTDAMNLKRGHEAKDGAEVTSSSSVTTSTQTPINVDSSSLDRTHVECSQGDPPIDNNPVASTITSLWLDVLLQLAVTCGAKFGLWHCECGVD